MTCKNCGAQAPDGVMFCGSCGARMDVQETAPAPVQQPAAQQYSQQSTGYAPYKADSDRLREPLSTGSYMLMTLIAAIPIVGLIMLLVWAFSSDTNINKKNWSRAALIWGLIGIGLTIILSVALAGLGMGLLNNFSDFAYEFSY